MLRMETYWLHTITVVGGGFIRRKEIIPSTEYCNKELRNSIAHCDFFIDENGDIFIEKEKNKIDIINQINRLKLIICAIDGTMQKCSADKISELITEGKELFKRIDENEKNKDMKFNTK